ncbi:MAG: hypothetical protein K2M50_02715, partial [Treponemataceae bacterium]|nr:hypothetical protein [Treponemataceae bacterium]
QKWRNEYMTWEMMLKERHDDGRDEGRTEGIAIGEKRGRTEGIAIGEKRGRAEGMAAGKIETARNMLKNGISADLITKCTGISAQQISELL